MNEKLLEQWKKAIQRCGGKESFEKELLPICPADVQAAYDFVRSEI